MKQKRKVKSLISSTSGSNFFLTGLLFLLWWILCFWAVTLFTSSVWVEAAGAESIDYPWIADKHEVLLKFWLIPYTENDPINEMYLTGNTFFMSGDNWISVDMSWSRDLNKYINYLWWDGGMNISSDNITIIGWGADSVFQKNDEATVLGWKSNVIDEWNNKAAPVILWWQWDLTYKTIWKNQEGSAVVWWENNKISDNGSYDFILWGQNNQIDGDNVVVWWARVKVNDKSNLFAFSYGDNNFEPKGSNAFYLNLGKGLWLNEEATNAWVDSKWAVSFWEVDITTQNCTKRDAWAQGTWWGCLVWCTELSASDWSNWRWEMIDHGTGCETLCDGEPHCMISALVSDVRSYTSYCTTNGVDTGHSHHCGGEENILNKYENVLFETMLIDSEDQCPKPGSTNWTENRCVFKCDGGYHLTWADENWNGGKCYKDCELPWDHTPIKHNETRIAYKSEDAYCSNAAWTHRNCSHYKATLRCDNWTLKVDSSSSNPGDVGKEATEAWYVFSGCMLHRYQCNTTVYPYTYSDITNTNKFNDRAASSWNKNDRGKTNGIRWVYELCIDYNTQWNGIQYQNWEVCNSLNATTNYYTAHYKLNSCRNGYTMYTLPSGITVCMKQCVLDRKTINHMQTMVAYKLNSPTCPTECEGETFTCNDGHLVSNKPWVNTWTYKYSSCTPTGVGCDWYDVSASTYNEHNAESKYLSCQKYSVSNKSCVLGNMVYKLDGCVDENNWHTENVDPIYNQYCVSDYGSHVCTQAWATVQHHFHYVNTNVLLPIEWQGTWNNWYWETADNCDWQCDNTFHLENGDCRSNSQDVYCSDYYTLPANASWDRMGYRTWAGTWNNGHWNDPQFCTWSCNTGWHKNAAWTACESDCSVVSCSEYPFDSEDDCPEHWHCSSCTKINSECNPGDVKRKLDYCDANWKVSGNTCVYDPACTPNYCSAYGLDSCPSHGYCSYCTIKYDDCTTWAVKAQLTSCEEGWKLSDDGKKCNEITNNPCSATTIDGYSVPALTHGQNKSLTQTKSSGWCTLSCTAVFSCSNATVTKASESCSCGDGCNISPSNGATWQNGSCTEGTKTCPAKWACPATNAWEQCKKYNVSSVFCPNTCPLQTTYTCKSDWTWDVDPTWSSNTCTLQGSWSCNTTTYPLTSKNVSHATSYSECTSYTVSSNACVTNKRYRVTACEDGYTVSSDGKSCEEDVVTCTDTRPYEADPVDCWYYDHTDLQPNWCYKCICPSGSQRFTSLQDAEAAVAECESHGQNGRLAADPENINGSTYCVLCYGDYQCNYNWNRYGIWATATTYASASPTCPTNCSTVTATCKSDWTWNRTMNTSCTPQPSWSCDTTQYPLTSNNVSHATSYSECTSYTVNSSNACVTNKRYRVTACEDGYTVSSDGKKCNEVTKCTYNWNQYNVWATATTYVSASPTCPTNCSTVTATCKSDWTWDRTMNTSCTPQPSWSCDTTQYPLTSNNVSHATSYSECTSYTVNSSNACVTNKRYRVTACEDGWEVSDDGKKCNEITNNPCSATTIDGYSVPALTHGQNKSLTQTKSSGWCTLSCSATFSCNNATVTKVSESCGCSNGCVVSPSGATWQNGSCVGICNPSSSSKPCNGGYSASWKPWGHSNMPNYGTNYLCKLGSDTVTCTCPSDKVWYGSSCGSSNLYCKNIEDEIYECYNWNVYDTGTVYKWYYRSCEDGYGSQSCHYCEDGYEWDSEEEKCVSSVTCPAKWACPATSAWQQCKKYSMASPTCPNTCSLKTYTCKSDWTWDISPLWSSSTCTPQPSWSCNTTTYPLTSNNVDHATSYSECTNYTVNSSNACVTNKRYRVTACSENYMVSSDGKKCEPNYWVWGSSSIGEQNFAVSNLGDTIIHYYGTSYWSCKESVFEDDVRHYPTIDDLCKKQLWSINQYDNWSSCWIYEDCSRYNNAYVCSDTHALWCEWHE